MRSKLVQPIILTLTAPANRIIADAARASVLALETIPSPHWEEWLNGLFTKSVRKVKESQIASFSEEWGFVRAGVAAAGVPNRYEDYPNKLRKAQVSGWQHQVPAWDIAAEPVNPDVKITLNSSLGMSTGKAAAQAAHALMLLSLQGESVHDAIVAVEEVDFSEVGKFPDTLVTDSGLTEIAPNSMTAFAVVL